MYVAEENVALLSSFLNSSCSYVVRQSDVNLLLSAFELTSPYLRSRTFPRCTMASFIMSLSGKQTFPYAVAFLALKSGGSLGPTFDVYVRSSFTVVKLHDSWSN